MNEIAAVALEVFSENAENGVEGGVLEVAENGAETFVLHAFILGAVVEIVDVDSDAEHGGTSENFFGEIDEVSALAASVENVFCFAGLFGFENVCQIGFQIWVEFRREVVEFSDFPFDF